MAQMGFGMPQQQLLQQQQCPSFKDFVQGTFKWFFNRSIIL